MTSRHVAIGLSIVAFLAICTAYHRHRERERAREPALIVIPELPKVAIPPEPLIDAARQGLAWLSKKAEESRKQREAQIAKLDQQIGRIQELVAAGNLDDAEVLLVDIHYLPVEPGATSEQAFVRTYDDKRTALARAIEARRRH